MPRRRLLALALALVQAGCIVRAREIEPIALESPPAADTVRTPVRAHLSNGSVVVFRDGLRVAADTLLGGAWRWDLTRRDSVRVGGVSLDSVVALETFTEGRDVGRTRAVSIPLTVVGTTLAAGGTLVGLKAIFGSCPTVYSDSGGSAWLEAEGFSYSIAPLFEMRDVDRLRVTPDAEGMVELEVRNEALETHYINHFGLLRVRHAAHEWVAPDPGGGAVAVGRLIEVSDVRDQAGRDMREIVAEADGVSTRAEPVDLEPGGRQATDHWLEVSLPAPAADSVALVLRLRNSLLNTVLLYEFMLERPGARALDWLGHELALPSRALELATWYRQHMGLWVQVRDADGWREVARVGDTGPIAWKDVAVPIPVPASDSLHIRIRYLADSWRVDRVAVGLDPRRLDATALHVHEVIGPDGMRHEAAEAAIRAPDDRYLTTGPGDQFRMRFRTGPAPMDDDRATTLFLDARGYYTEWVRGDWLRQSVTEASFRPHGLELADLVRRWADVRDEFEQRFFETRIPVR